MRDTLVSLGTDTSMRKQEVLSLFFTTKSGLCIWIVLSVWMLKPHKMVAFLFSMTFDSLCSHQLLSCGRPTFLHKHLWMSWPNLSCRFRYSVEASMRQQDTRWSVVSVCLSHTLHFGSAPFSNMFANFFLVGSGPVQLWWSPQSQISDWQSQPLLGQRGIYIRVTSTNRVFIMKQIYLSILLSVH